MFLTLVTLLMSGTPALANEPELYQDYRLNLSYWRLGLSLEGRVGTYLPMFEQEGNPLFQNTGLRFQGEVMANPAYLRGNARAIYSPMSIIDIAAHGGLDYHLGSVATVMGFPSADFEYGDDAAMNALWEEGNHSSATGWHAGASVTLKAKAGPLIVMLNGDMTHWNVNAEDNVEGDWYFEREQELMLALGGDQVLSLNGIFLYEIDRDLSDGASLRVGNLTTRRTSIAAEDELLRTGLLAIWTRNEHFSHILTVQPYLRDRAFTSAMPPFVGYIVKYQR